MITTTGTTSTTGTSPIYTRAEMMMPMAYSLGMIASTLDVFSGKEVIKYFEKLEQRSSLDGWSEDQTVKLLKFKLVGEAYNFFKADPNLDTLSYSDLKARFIGKFRPIKLPGENQLMLSRCYQRYEDVSTYCTRLRALGAKLLNEDLERAEATEIAGLKKNNKEIIMNQFKIGLRKDLLREVGILLLRESDLDLDKAETLVRLQETTLMMIQGKRNSSNVSQIDQEKICFNCGKMGHLSTVCRSGRERMPSKSFSCYKCGKIGHLSRECGSEETVRKVTCYHCNKVGHYANVCPEKRNPPGNWSPRRRYDSYEKGRY
ncbi:uncharacterized protein [Leptinotarsa decemlineata]|uniref:uncharacterized protein n=1 Tax=Leptinotarsa decemlineata TaxID=7539 RepID=UPI003D306858